MHHALKCKSEYFDAVIRGRKKFELRKNDRNFQPKDTFILIEVENGISTGRISAMLEIQYVFKGGEYGLDPDYCIFNW
jgi:hypothetical protein